MMKTESSTLKIIVRLNFNPLIKLDNDGDGIGDNCDLVDFTSLTMY